MRFAHTGVQLLDIPTHTHAHKAATRIHHTAADPPPPYPQSNAALNKYKALVFHGVPKLDSGCSYTLRRGSHAPCAFMPHTQGTSSTVPSRPGYGPTITGTWPCNYRSFAPRGATVGPVHGECSCYGVQTPSWWQWTSPWPTPASLLSPLGVWETSTMIAEPLYSTEASPPVVYSTCSSTISGAQSSSFDGMPSRRSLLRTYTTTTAGWWTSTWHSP